MGLYIEVQKTNVDIFSHILNLISLKRGFSLFLAWVSGSYRRLISLWRIFTWLINLLDYDVLHICLIPCSSLIYSCRVSWGFKLRNDLTISWIGPYHLVSEQGSGLNFLFYLIFFLSYEEKKLNFFNICVFCSLFWNFVCFIILRILLEVKFLRFFPI